MNRIKVRVLTHPDTMEEDVRRAADGRELIRMTPKGLPDRDGFQVVELEFRP
jgi:hypothetical protein